jgi:hypothetical protein
MSAVGEMLRNTAANTPPSPGLGVDEESTEAMSIVLVGEVGEVTAIVGLMAVKVC